MSMYSDLLGAAHRSCAEGGERPPLGQLIAETSECRRRLVGRGGGGAGSPATAGVVGDIAVQLEYDLKLMELCERLEIDHAPARFDQPVSERQRLESALRHEGVALADLRTVQG